MKIGILGGGLAGFALANFLKSDFEILEKEEVPGGLCRSFSKSGFWYDFGGHIIFSRDDEITDLMVRMLRGNSSKLYRNNKIFYKGRFIKYPFENGLGQLPPRDRDYCLEHYLNNPHPKPKSNFKEWVYYTFGKGIAELYLIPYNEKIWKRKTKELGLEGFAWVKRIPRPPKEDVIKSSRGMETEGYKHQLYFHYPKTGGIQSLFKCLLEPVGDGLTTTFEVKSVRRESGKWIVSNGRKEKCFERIVSTIPITDFIGMLENVPVKVKRAATRLQYNSIIVVMVGISKIVQGDKFAVYYPQRNLIFHRVCFFRYLGENYVPKGCSSAVAEITVRSGDPLFKAPEKKIIERVTRDMEKAGILKREYIVTTDVRREKYGYVVYDLEYAKNMKTIKDYLDSAGIHILGRFGEFKYLNMDMTIKNAKE